VAASSKRALLGGAAANLAVAVTKFAVGTLTGSTVMIAEGIHSVVDCGNSGLMLFGGRRSTRPADDTHPFGYGLELYFWSFVVAMVVFGGGGALSIFQGARALVHPHPVTQLWPNYLVIGAAAIFEGVSLFIGVREFASHRREKRFIGSTLAAMRMSKNPAMFVTVLEDTAALAGLAIAAVGVTLSHYLSMPAFDGIASMLIGVVLMLEAALLGAECRGLVTGEAAGPANVESIRRTLARHTGIGAIESLRTLQLGSDTILLAVRVRFPPTLAVAEVERLAAGLEKELRGENPAIKHVVFYMAPNPATSREQPLDPEAAPPSPLAPPMQRL
jgi:cation diffusion facilitator family transporter